RGGRGPSRRRAPRRLERLSSFHGARQRHRPPTRGRIGRAHPLPSPGGSGHMSESRSARFCMVRGMRRALIAAASALVLLPAASPTITVSLFTWFGWPLGSATVPAGSPAGWYSASAQSPVDAQSLQALGIGLKAGGTGSGSRAYAGYVEVDTNEPPPTPAGSP